MRDFYRGRRVLVTGHTGFKGAWLCWWLKELGAEVSGFALAPEDARGNLFRLSGLGKEMRSLEGDLGDAAAVREALGVLRPELVVHLAAQAFVLPSYDDPVGTFRANTQGTVHLLDACRREASVRAVLVATSDKCYDPAAGPGPHAEGDVLGGRDPYAASKAMAELAAASFRTSFYAPAGVGLATARAGNVVGGGDFGARRLLPDLVESAAAGRPVALRHPGATRPWQHVLDALRGYLTLLMRLRGDPARHSGAYNFGPGPAAGELTVREVAETFIAALGRGSVTVDPAPAEGREAETLRLDPAKAARELGWSCRLSMREAVESAARWYAGHLADPQGARDRTLAEIRAHMEGA